MADSLTRKNIFETFDNYDYGSDEDSQVSDPDGRESNENGGCKEQYFKQI